jgi:hypothetical protein
MLHRLSAHIYQSALILVVFAAGAFAQTEQLGADRRARGQSKLQVEYVGYRAAQWEAEALREKEIDRVNEGGLIHVYLRNVSEEPVELRFWRANGEDESHWRLVGFLAWDRMYDKQFDPGEVGVLEINAVTSDFGPGRSFQFSFVDRSWRPVVYHDGSLDEDTVQVASVRVLPGLQELEVHVRHTGEKDVELTTLEVAGHEATKVDWVGAKLEGPGHAIAHVALAQPLPTGTVMILKLGVAERRSTRYVYAHRRAFEDYFPIGCWSNNPETYELLRQHHIETVVRGGSPEDPFFAEVAAKYGFRTMTPAEGPAAPDVVRRLGDQAPVACWLLADEPDWSTPANIMAYVDRTVRQFNSTKPTFITLCRNIKFFEYASIPDIPCMDHYCVTAPTSSVWPKRYGTQLVETAYYTRDLKAASEPKPIWVWTQGIADWDERPQRPVPTPNELAAQLMLNLGRGAKGILWFNYDHEIAERYPDTREAMQQWGRVMRLTRNDFLAADPIAGPVEAPDKVDAVALVSRDKLLICVTNVDYAIDPEAYPFIPKEDVLVAVDLPPWIEPAKALAIEPDGIRALPLNVKRGRATVGVGDLEVCRLIVLPNDPTVETEYAKEYLNVIADESRSFGG